MTKITLYLIIVIVILIILNAISVLKLYLIIYKTLLCLNI